MGNTNVCCPIPWDVSHGIPTILMDKPGDTNHLMVLLRIGKPFHHVTDLQRNRHYLQRALKRLTDIWAWSYLGLTDISVSAKMAPVGVDRMQTICARNHNEPSQDSYLAAMLAHVFS